MRLSTFPPNGIRFKGGGGGSALPPVAPAPPPPTTTSLEVQQARRDAAKAAAKRMGMRKTILSGETGDSYKVPLGPQTILNGGVAAEQKKTLLSGTA